MPNANAIIIHGFMSTNHPLYRLWSGMKSRCLNINSINYRYYGGRGIKVCERWLVFVNFANDMYETWKPGLTLERKNNNDNYDITNCIWADRFQQNHNHRIRKDNTVGATGVSPRDGKFRSYYFDHKKMYSLGNFNTIEEAVEQRERFISLYNSGNSECYKLCITKSKNLLVTK